MPTKFTTTMPLLKTAHHLTIANGVTLLSTAIIFLLCYALMGFIPDYLFLLLGINLLIGTASYIMNIIISYRASHARWRYWTNTILSILAGYYFIILTSMLLIGGCPADKVLVFQYPSFGELLHTSYSVTTFAFLLLLFAWTIQYIINSIYVIRLYKL